MAGGDPLAEFMVVADGFGEGGFEFRCAIGWENVVARIQGTLHACSLKRHGAVCLIRLKPTISYRVLTRHSWATVLDQGSVHVPKHK